MMQNNPKPDTTGAKSFPESRFRLNAHREHRVEFYDTQNYLCGAVAEFLGKGLRTEQPVIAMVTPAHRAFISSLLRSQGLDIEGYTSITRVKWLDARAVLASFMNGTMPDEERFTGYMANLVPDTPERFNVRIFGEMVDLLVSDGNAEGAVCLEELWNNLCTTRGFSLMCAYEMGTIYRTTQSLYFRKICEQHTHFTFQPKS